MEGACSVVVRSGCACCVPLGALTRGDGATTGSRPLGLVGGVIGSGVWCVCGAGEPPLVRRGDGATTPSETAARCNIGLSMNEEGLRLSK